MRHFGQATEAFIEFSQCTAADLCRDLSEARTIHDDHSQ